MPRGDTTATRSVMADNMLFTSIIAQMGFCTTQTQTVTSQDRGHGEVPTLRRPEDFIDLLAKKAAWPLSCEPEAGSLRIATVRLESYDPAACELGTLAGSRVGIYSFAKQVFFEYRGGLVLRSAIEHHEEIVEPLGSVVGCVRVLTILRSKDAEVLYGLWKIPSPDAMTESSSQDGTRLAALDRRSGKLLRCRRGNGPNQEEFTVHPMTEVALEGMTIPSCEEVLDAATKANRVFARFDVLGWDICITPPAQQF
ncbi:MAG: sugar-transfer associated ATP-grasp domain-containing protein [Pseudomonadota bacterium]